MMIIPNGGFGKKIFDGVQAVERQFREQAEYRHEHDAEPGAEVTAIDRSRRDRTHLEGPMCSELARVREKH